MSPGGLGAGWWSAMSSQTASLVVEAGGDREDVRRAFVRRYDRLQAFQLFVVAKVFDPVGARRGRRGNLPLHCGVALPVWPLQPVKPAARQATLTPQRTLELKEERLQPDFSFCLYVLWLQLVKIRNPGSRKFRLCVLSERTLNLQVDKGAGSSAGIGTGCRFHLLTVPNTIR